MMHLTEPLWTSAELQTVLGSVCKQPCYIDGIQIDSRDVLPGDLFVALPGSDKDGHEFVADALARGASAALVSGFAVGVSEDDMRLIKVDDVPAALERIASAARERVPANITAVTGSAGKTTVVQMLRQAFEKADKTHSSVRSFNNHVGVPLSLARMPRDARFGVFELGMNKPGEIAARAQNVKPDVAIITTVGAAHLAGFDAVEDIAAAKAEIFASVKPGGVAVVGIDHPFAAQLQAAAEAVGVKVVTVSADGDADADVSPVLMNEKHDCTCLTAEVLGARVTYKIAQPGREWVLNSLLVLTAVKLAGGDLGQAALSLAVVDAEPGRGRMHELNMGDGGALLIDDSYNANPLSMKASLGRLAMQPMNARGRKLAVFADMQELGDDSGDIHLGLVPAIKLAGIHKVFAMGPRITEAAKVAGVSVEEFSDKETLGEQLAMNLRSGDVLLVKGANSAGLSALVGDLIARNVNDYHTGQPRFAQVAE